MSNMRNIFTFWEPRDRMSGYISLCLKTWKKYCPEYDIRILDYENLADWLSKEELEAVLCRKMPLAMQSNCLRCALLKKHGGIWMDADTILTRPLQDRLRSAEVTFVGRKEDGHIVNYGAFVNATGPDSYFMNRWHEELVPRVALSARYRANPLLRAFFRPRWRKIRNWDYCVNAIIDPLADEMVAKGMGAEYHCVDVNSITAMPELTLRECDPGLSAEACYQRYWFEPGSAEEAREKTGGLILLHNSWTPDEFRRMSSDEFLRSGVRLAELLADTGE